MKVLVLTGMYPTASDPAFGGFVAEQVASLRRADPALACEVLFFDGRASRLNYLRAAARLGGTIARGRHDLIHAHYGLAGLVAACQRRAPVVLTLHGSDVNVAWQRALTRCAARRARAVVAVSRRLAERVEGSAPGRVEVIPCGVDLGRFRPWPRAEARRRLGWTGDEARVLFPGDPARPVKGYGLFRRTLEAMRRRGGPPLVEVALSGVPPDRVPDHLNACDLMLMTSRAEGSPMAVKEAMACDLPVVSLDVGDVADLIDGARGCAVVARGGDRTAERLARAALDTLASGRRSEGRSRVAALSLEAVARRLLDLYRRVAAPGAPRSTA